MEHFYWGVSCLYLEFSEFIKLFIPQHLEGIRLDAIRLYRKRMREYERYGESAYSHVDAERIESAETIEEVVRILQEIVEHRTSNDDSYVLDTDDTRETMILFRCISRVVLPGEPESVRIFRWSEKIPWLPYAFLGVPVLSFMPDAFYKAQMTSTGSALARTIGQDSNEPRTIFP